MEQLPSELSVMSLDFEKKYTDEVSAIEWKSYEQVSPVTNQTEYTAHNNGMASHYIPSGASLEVEFRVTQSDGSPIEFADQTALCSNGWSLFEDAELDFNNDRLSYVAKPGKCTTMKFLVEKGREWLETVGQNQHFYLDSVSDGHTGMTYVAPHADDISTVPVQALAPVSAYHEVQGYKSEIIGSGATLGTTGYAISNVRKNPSFDASFKEKVDQAVMATSTSTNQRVILPLRDVFPQLETLDKAVKGLDLRVRLHKISNVKEALYGALADATLVIDRVKLWVPQIKPTLAGLKRLEESLSSRQGKVAFQCENLETYSEPIASYANSGDKTVRLNTKINRPKRVYVMFQHSDRDTTVGLNPLQFDKPATFSDIHLLVDGSRVPYTTYNPSKDRHRILHDIFQMGEKLMDSSDSSALTSKSWDEMYPIYCFDADDVDSGAFETKSNVNLELKWTQTGSATSEYRVHSVMISEREGVIDTSSGSTSIRLF